MKVIIARSFVLLFVLLSFTVNAKSFTVAEKRAKLITEWMEKKLELNSDQILKVKTLNLECEKEIDRLAAEQDGFSCMQAVRDSLLQKEQNLKNILTIKQLAFYIENKCELKEMLKNSFKQI